MDTLKVSESVEVVESLIKKRRWILEQLKSFEEKYGLSTEEFINAWKKGALPEPDDPDMHGDFIVWEGLHDELLKIEKELKRRISS